MTETPKKSREILKQGTKLRLRPLDSEDTFDVYEILSVVGEGGSAVCYEAGNGSLRGRLKEFYPKNAWEESLSGLQLTRNPDSGQLTVQPEQKEIFHQQCEEFVQPYTQMQRIRYQETSVPGLQTHALRILNNYMPVSQVLCGYTGEQYHTGSVYVWTPGDREGVEFDRYLREIRARMGEQGGLNSEDARQILEGVLGTLVSLADCIGILHGCGILHLDIKPSNFMIACDSEGKILPQHISLYDVNSLYDIRNVSAPLIIGTEGYMAPELRYGKADPRADLYSIGAMLWRVMSPTGTYEDNFTDEQYGEIGRRVRESGLIRLLETAGRASLEDSLTMILGRCLAYDRNRRYRSAEELKKALKKASGYLREQKGCIYSPEKLSAANSTAAIYRLLSRTPLYQGISSANEEIRIAIAGDGTWSRRFLDISLTVCQNLLNPVSVACYAKNGANAAFRYRSVRPGITSYVDIDGKGKVRNGEPYAYVRFFDAGSTNTLAAKILKKGCTYAFISLETDEKSLALARELYKASSHPVVVCIYQGDGSVLPADLPAETPDFAILRVMEPVRLSRTDEQMAFNTYLTWRGSSNEDLRTERKHFRDKYQFNASYANALSIHYKLKMLELAGYPLKGRGKNARAEQLQDLFDSPAFIPMLDELAMREHRRWTVERLTDGWRGLDSYPESLYYEKLSVSGEVRRNEEKIHPCICHCKIGNPLGILSKEKWDDPDFMPPELDELDRVSLKVHRTLLAEGRNSYRPFSSNHGLYCNYKEPDYAIIRAIPDILTGNRFRDTVPDPYTPQPIDTSEVRLSDELVGLTEKLAENIHELWARTRIEEGWHFGQKKSEVMKTTPNLVPYAELPEEEKQYDRQSAMETLKTIVGLGYRIER